MKTCFLSLVLSATLILPSKPTNSIESSFLIENVNVVWGKGANCTGRAICYIEESQSKAVTDVKVLYSPLIDITQVYLPKSTLSKKEIEYLTDAESISLDKPSQIEFGTKKITLDKGEYKIYDRENGYLLIPTK